MEKQQQSDMTEPKRKRGGQAKAPEERRNVWIGAHVTEAKRLEYQARAAREMPGKPFADWLVACVEAGPAEKRRKSAA
jgi:hypothetical protein